MGKGARYFGILLAVLLCLMLAAGCGPKEKGTTSTGQEKATQQSTTAVKTESIADLLTKGQKVKGISYDYVVTAGSMTQRGKVWLQGDKMKFDTTVSGQRMLSYFDRQTNTIITYYSAQNRAVKLSAPESKDKAPAIDEVTGSIDPAKAKLLRTEVYKGMTCRVIDVSTGQGDREIVWISEEYGLPVRTEVTEASGQKMVMEFENIKAGSIPAEEFELPKGVQVTDLNEMLNKLPGNINIPKP